MAIKANTISDDEDETFSAAPTTSEVSRQAIATEVEQLWPKGNTSPATFDFESQEPSTAIIEEDIIYEENRNVRNDVMTEFAQLHQRLGHLPPAKIQKMATEGLLPRRLATCPVPACRSCLFGQATRRPWRNKPRKGAKAPKLRKATFPGECVSVDQLESSTPGLIAQMKGWITKKRYRVATIFVDHYSGWSYVHLQKSTNAIETLEAKRAFELHASRQGITVKQYQADNGRFA